MKKQICSLVMSLFLVAAVSTTVFAAGQKLVVVGESTPPYEFIQNGEVVGIDVDIAKAIFKKLNIDAEYQILPWTRAWKMVETGEADAVFTTSRKDARKPFLYYPEEDMWNSEFAFFVRKDKKQPSFNSYEDAKGLTVGVIRGNSYNDDFFNAKLKLDEARDDEQNFKKLAKGRIDLYIQKKGVGLYTLKLLGLQDEIAVYDKIMFSKGYPMPFAKNSSYPNNKKIAAQFEQELKNMKANGEYDKIFAKWLK